MEPKKIFIAGALLSRYPLICSRIYEVCEEERIDFGILSGVKNIWIRDYMPIPVHDGGYIKFKYAEAFVKYPARTESVKSWATLPTLTLVNAFLDGGNCVMRENGAFVTDKVIKDNGKEAVDVLQKRLKVPVYILPVEPGDDLGHADGIINFAPDGSIFINDYTVMKSQEYDEYLEKVVSVVESAGFKWKLFPYAYHKMPLMSEKKFRADFPHADDFNPAYGYYINYLQIGESVVLPVFGIEEDRKAMEMFGAAKIKPIDCSRLSIEGGLIHCVTWENFTK